jgi:hypothetical protein
VLFEPDPNCPDGQFSGDLMLQAVPNQGQPFLGWQLDMEDATDRDTGRVTRPAHREFHRDGEAI